jgi:hypothetical protein
MPPPHHPQIIIQKHVAIIIQSPNLFFLKLNNMSNHKNKLINK